MEIYLDNSATTRVSDEVLKVMTEMLVVDYGNASSLHRKGFEAEQRVQKAREQIARILGAKAEEITFTSGGTESNNLALIGTANAMKRRGNKIIIGATEHSSIMGTARYLQDMGFVVVFIKPDMHGVVDPQKVADAVDSSTILVSIMHVNSETGSINLVPTIANMVKRKNPAVVIHSDCVQSFCKVPVTPEKWGVDMVSISAHKIHGPKGCGALYVKKGTRILPILHNKGNGLRPGTLNTAGICGFAIAAESMWANHAKYDAHYRTLQRHFLENVKKNDELCINSPENAAPYIMNISVEGIRSETLIHFLAEREIYVSSGSACSKGAKSHVLTAMGLSDSRIDSALRVSLCNDNKLEDIDMLLDALAIAQKTLARAKKQR